MIWIILATGFGAANFIAIALLFRRLRHNLDRQLSDMRAERNSEWILHALQGVPEERVRPARTAGGGSHQLPRPRPVRRKEHLRLYNGGAAIAAAFVTLGAVIRAGRESHGAHIISTALTTTALAAATVTVMTVTPWQRDIETVPTSPPSTVTTTPSPGSGSPGARTAPAPGPRTPDNTPAPTTGSRRGSLQKRAPESTAPSTATAGTTPEPLPAATTASAAPSATSSVEAATASPGTCVTIIVLAVHTCLAGGG
jgi:hypothetical protein